LAQGRVPSEALCAPSPLPDRRSEIKFCRMVQVEEIDEVTDEADKENDKPKVKTEDDKVKGKKKGKKGRGEGEEEEETAPAAQAPAAPEMPKLSFSQFAPLILMFGLNKFDIEKEGYTRHVEVVFLCVQVVCIGAILYLRVKIDAMSDDGAKIDIPAVKQFGQEVKPANKQSPKEYDLDKWSEQRNQALIGLTVMSGIYYKWRYIFPLALQIFMTPSQLYEGALFQIHILGKEKARPFPTPNPLGFEMPKWPEPEEPAPPVEDKKAGKSANKKSD